MISSNCATSSIVKPDLIEKLPKIYSKTGNLLFFKKNVEENKAM
jgi:hypothetical protein